MNREEYGRNGCGVFENIFRHLPEGMEENHENISQDTALIALRIEPRVFRIRNRCPDRLTSTRDKIAGRCI
jgi:hypothetical protein